MNWSGGKDSSLCLYKVVQANTYDVKYLLTSVNKTHDRISMHGVRTELLRQQADAIGIPLKLIELTEQPDMAEYEKAMEDKTGEILKEGIRHTVFGDIFLEDLRTYREKKLSSLGIETVFPLWKIQTKTLMQEFLELGFKAIVVCVNAEFLDKSFCGRIIDEAFVNDLPNDVDLCGENGEYHSFVYDGPIFRTPVGYEKGEIVYREYERPKEELNGHNNSDSKESENYGFYFCDLVPSAS
jgi:uncharacterized protein (TIGR00290 family)